jgi:hypothetical protein
MHLSNRNPNIFGMGLDKYKVHKKIGSGNFLIQFTKKGGQGSVFLVSKKSNENLKYALKVINFDKLEDANKGLKK